MSHPRMACRAPTAPAFHPPADGGPCGRGAVGGTTAARGPRPPWAARRPGPGREGRP
ncbi:hypothetical protein SUDANB121_03189 [Nocardiopsis dassonvillei]